MGARAAVPFGQASASRRLQCSNKLTVRMENGFDKSISERIPSYRTVYTHSRALLGEATQTRQVISERMICEEQTSLYLTNPSLAALAGGVEGASMREAKGSAAAIL